MEDYQDLIRRTNRHLKGCRCRNCTTIKQMRIACADVVTRQPTASVASVQIANQASSDPGTEEPANAAARKQQDDLRAIHTRLPSWDDIETEIEQEELFRKIAYQFVSDPPSEDEEKSSPSQNKPAESRAEVAEMGWEVVGRQKYDSPKEEFCNLPDLEDAYKELEEEGTDKN